MRSNLPITNNEYILTATDSIVSKTDTKGIITYINDDFVRISGFKQEELIGQPHNIVRHPDMPSEAFADMWKNLKAGRPWTGLVKNRCKNGDHYWVVANATPLMEKGQHIGYMSVRHKPSREQVEEITKIYQKFKDGKQGNLSIHHGEIIKNSIVSKINFIKNITIKSRLTSVLVLLSAMLIGIGIFGYFGLNKTFSGLKTVYMDRTIPLDQIASIHEYIQKNRSLIQQATRTPTPEIIKTNTEKVEKNIETITEIWKMYMSSKFTPEEEVLANKFANSRKAFVVEGLKPAVASLRAGDIEQTVDILNNKIHVLFEPLDVDVRALKDLQISVAKAEYEQAEETNNLFVQISIGLISTGILMSLFLGITLVRAITIPLSQTITNLEEISQGNYSSKIEIKNRDEIGKMLENLVTMQIKMGFELNETKIRAQESLRLKVALDNVSTNVMVADNNRNVIYMNAAIHNMFRTAENEIKAAMPFFDINDIMGKTIDRFHKNPDHQKQILATFTSLHKAQIAIGSRTFDLVASPVINELKERIGSVVEWTDVTEELKVENEVAEIVNAAAVNGDFSKRIDMSGKAGFFKNLSEGMNRLMDVTNRGLNDVVTILGYVAKGDLTHKVEEDYKGLFGDLKTYLNNTVDQLHVTLADVKQKSSALKNAAGEVSSTAQSLSQGASEQAASVEETSASLEQMGASIDQNATNSKQTESIASKSAKEAVEGGSSVNETVKAMKQIADKINIIEDIAYQTNLLALNAAIEAARAGEHGKGFAVVASEVRKLAERSQVSANEIGTLATSSVEIAEKAGQLIAQIVPAINKTADLVMEISASSEEQSSGVNEINKAMGQLDQVSQQNASASEELSAIAEELNSQADLLIQSVMKFKLSQSFGGDAPTASGGPTGKAPKISTPDVSFSSLNDDDEEFQQF